MNDIRQVLEARRRQLTVLIVVLLALYVVLPQLGSFKTSSTLIRHAYGHDTLLAGGFVLLTYFSAATTYLFLSARRLKYADTLLVEIASNFVNRLLPAGLGSLGANYAYLRHRRLQRAEAVSVVTVNNTLGMIGHLFITAVVLGLYHDRLQALHVPQIPHVFIGIALVLCFVIAAALFSSRIQRQIRKLKIIMAEQFGHYRRHPWHVLAALGSSMTLTLCNILSLWYCTLALHGNVPFVTVLIVFSLGVGVGTLTPSPGGLGGVEAGLLAGFVAYHVPAAQALATVLLYRLMSYWLSLLIGSVAFVVCQRRGLFSSKY